ncbi:PspC domain-containing protein [Nocardioides sp. GXQ0305]|uniref:PspC domain-containing protein n=1 Tax=Nocardioides sp. GXQ0305 TaxID=3423912 RepID=UPI003D7EA185
MTTTPPEAPHEPRPEKQGPDQHGDSGPRTSRDEMRDLGRLRRSVTDRKVAGVAGGLARHLDIDPVILRVAFVVLTFFGGAGLILYGAAWALVPEEDRDRAAVDLDERSRTVALVALTVIAALALVGDSWGGGFWFPWPLIVVAAVVGVVWLAVGSRGRPVPPPQPEVDPETGEPLPAAASWTGGPTESTSYAPPRRARDPRKRGPLLFWFTLALIAFALGVLGVVDLAGVPVADSAYAALAVGVTGVMLLVGSVMGRAGGLILIGLVASTALVGTTVADRWDGDHVEVNPTSAAEVQDSYDIERGDLVLDLTDVSDLDELDGRTISLTGEAGRLEVVLPDEVDADVEATMEGPGGYDLFGAQGGGIDWTRSATHDSDVVDAPSLTIDTRLAVGEIEVTTE